VANPVLKSGVWYFHYRPYAGPWKREKMGAARSADEPNGLTKLEARRLNGEKQAQQDRIRRGLEPAPKVNEDKTLGELMLWWLRHRLTEATRKHIDGAIHKHVVHWRPEVLPGHPDWEERAADLRTRLTDGQIEELIELAKEHQAVAIGRLPPGDVTSGKVDGFLHAKEAEGLAPGTLNHYRSWIRTAYNEASRAERYFGKNPVTKEGVKVRVVPEREHEFFREEWVPPIIEHVAPQHRNLVAASFYQGFRKGEAFGLYKTDVDLERADLVVRRSHRRTTTKGKKEKRIPIHPEAVPYLLEAMADSPGDLVFMHPDPTGRMVRYREDFDLASSMRSAMRRAGVGVTGYSHTCRRCAHREESQDGLQRYCPACQTTAGRGVKLYPHTLVVPLRFHDTRHTTASLLAMKGATQLAIQKFLRHSDPRMTERYMHLAPGFLRDEIGRLSFPSRPDAGPASEPARHLAIASGSFGTPLSPDAPRTPARSSDATGIRHGNSIVALVGATGFEPATPCPPGASQGIAPGSTLSNSVDSLGVSSRHSFHAAHADPPDPRGFGTRLSPGQGPRLRTVQQGWLTVKDVARHLGVCRATVYALVDSGQLPSVRLLKNVIRIDPADLAAFTAAQKGAHRG
jgi:excisionase family DNA binding protein